MRAATFTSSGTETSAITPASGTAKPTMTSHAAAAALVQIHSSMGLAAGPRRVEHARRPYASWIDRASATSRISANSIASGYAAAPRSARGGFGTYGCDVRRRTPRATSAARSAMQPSQFVHVGKPVQATGSGVGWTKVSACSRTTCAPAIVLFMRDVLRPFPGTKNSRHDGTACMGPQPHWERCVESIPAGRRIIKPRERSCVR